ncbi:hypothetical protein H2O64_03580 [Kordia sp. YSTF-M3]|uniref:Class I lanthipeptide n=1 Tax=Kordia aestuariivivens TaxID=2759037 RepID=A0ABR7Q5B0_9FLAO|nr:hypothetical protein [Kordia aestuariivivens]MBC8753735.1 hypothetical protein [Kordia aestuariivivens]
MKKKDFKQKLQLKKRVISNLDCKKVKGGTDPIAMTVAVTIRPTTFVTKPEVCETHGDVCTLYCETKEICSYTI